MRKVHVRLEKDPEGDWWAQSPEASGFYAYGETREEALANAKDALSIFLGIDEDSFELEITETGAANNGKG